MFSVFYGVSVNTSMKGLVLQLMDSEPGAAGRVLVSSVLGGGADPRPVSINTSSSISRAVTWLRSEDSPPFSDGNSPEKLKTLPGNGR